MCYRQLKLFVIFNYDKTFSKEKAQQQVFEETSLCVKSVLTSIVCIFVYI